MKDAPVMSESNWKATLLCAAIVLTFIFGLTTGPGPSSVSAQTTSPLPAYSSWSISNFPGSGAAAAATKSAGVASIKHVTNCISFSATSTGAVTAATGNIFIQDGANTVWILAIAFPTAGAAGVQLIPPTSVCGLHIIGTAGNSMAVGFSAGVAAVQQSVTLTGYDLQ